MAEEVRRMRKANIIEIAAAKWASLVAILSKHYGLFCLRIDYR